MQLKSIVPGVTSTGHRHQKTNSTATLSSSCPHQDMYECSFRDKNTVAHLRIIGGSGK